LALENAEWDGFPKEDVKTYKTQEYVLCGSLPCLFTPRLTLMTYRQSCRRPNCGHFSEFLPHRFIAVRKYSHSFGNAFPETVNGLDRTRVGERAGSEKEMCIIQPVIPSSVNKL